MTKKIVYVKHADGREEIDLTAWKDKPNKKTRMTAYNRRRQAARLNAKKRREYAESLDGPVSIERREHKEGEAF